MNDQSQQRPNGINPHHDIQEHPLFRPLIEAIEQALYGKGQRHGGGRTPFLEQPIFHYARMHGRGFLTGQAAKKLEEAASTRNDEAFITELLGTIVYTGAAIVFERQKMVREKAEAERNAINAPGAIDMGAAMRQQAQGGGWWWPSIDNADEHQY